ncbi:MAG: site-specific tyrosine recombinase XerD [Saprospiraceae bacterium]|nr:site-specific tyrosine recombinase XerD [Saprospiraceae bacterium]
MDWRSCKSGFRAYLQLERSLSENSVQAYVRDVDKLSGFDQQLESPKGPLGIEMGDIQQFLSYLHDLGLGARSQGRILSGIKAFYKYLLVEDLMQEDPSELIEGPKLGQKIPEVLTYAEIQAMLDSIDLSLPQGTRNRAMLETLYACGLRVSELINLKINGFYPDLGFIRVIGKNDKERLVPIGDDAIKHIQLYLEHVRKKNAVKKGEESMLFLNRRGSRLSRVMVFNIVKQAARDAGIKKKVSPHTLRHSFATHLVEGGANLKAVQDMLGHESITTTEIYTHLDKEYLRETILNFHPKGRL